MPSVSLRHFRSSLVLPLLVVLVGCQPLAEDDIEDIVGSWYDEAGPFAGTYEISTFTCVSTDDGQRTITADVGYGFCRTDECPLLAGYDNRVMTLEKDRGDWDVTDDGDFLDGSCGEGSTSSTTEDLLIASSWRWVDSVYPASDETGSGTDDTWQFAPTNLGNGSLLINGGGTGDRWFLSETIWTEWTLSETYDVFLVIDGEGTEPYTYGIKAISETELELHHDVGVESDRIDRFAAE